MLSQILGLLRPKTPSLDRAKIKAFWITAVVCEELDDSTTKDRGSYMWARMGHVEQKVTQDGASITVRTVIYDGSLNRPESVFFETEIHFTIEDGYFAIPDESGTFVHHGMGRSGTLVRPSCSVHAVLDEPERPPRADWKPRVVNGGGNTE